MQGRHAVLIVLALLVSGPAAAQERYFPSKVFNGTYQDGDFFVDWYSKHLVAMGEPSLSTTKLRAETYRILWLRTFHAPMVFRLTLSPDGTATLITKRTDGLGGYEPGKLVLDKETKIGKQETKALIGRLEQANFWRLVSADPNKAGFDGSEWIVEGMKDGIYHVISRWIGKGITDWTLPIMKRSGEDLQPIY